MKKLNQDPLSKEYKESFLEHYYALTENVEVMIEDLCNNKMQERILEQLYHVFHNISSMSSYLEIEPLKRLSLLVENELKSLQGRKKALNQETIEWFCEINTMLKIWHQDLQEGKNLSKIRYSLLKLPDIHK